MNFILESVVVGIYSVLCFMLANTLQLGYPGVLLLTGFIKHFFGYYLGIHREYCKKYSVEFTNNFSTVFVESLGEAVLYLIMGTILLHTEICKSKEVVFFGIGFILHIIFELLDLHPQFCNKFQ